MFLTSCANAPWVVPKTPRVLAKLPSLELNQSGTVATPAQAAVTTTTASLPVPAGATVTVKLPDTLEGPSPVLETKTTSETFVAPTSHVPPPPPTATDMARASGVRWFYIGGVLCGLVAIFALYRGHPVNAAVLGGGAVLLPIIGNLASSEWAIRVAGVVVALSVGITIAWFLLRKYHPDYIAELKAKIHVTPPIPPAG